MTGTWIFSLAALGAAALSSPASASLLDARFDGVVASQSGSGLAVGNAASGEFIYSTESGAFISFVVAGISIQPGFATTATFTPDLYSAIYRGQLSPVQQGGTLNNTFVVDLEGLNPWSDPSAVALLTNPAALSANLDTADNPNSAFPSTFGYNVSNADGTDTRSLSANLTRLQVSVPEPATSALLMVACMGIAYIRRRA